MEKYSVKYKGFRPVWLVLAVLWSLFIWSNSLHTAAQSTGQSLGLMELLAPILDLIPLSHDVLHVIIRKLGHFTEFGVLGLLWSAALLGKGNRRPLLAWGLCVAVACCDEFIQLFVPGRAGMLMDVGIDSAGAGLAVLVCWGIFTLYHRKRA